ncbi:hypothetical protein Btru_042151, partial [Bulinus truncatus]
GECRTVSCSPGKIPTQEGDCITAIKTINGLGYKLAMKLRPINSLELTKKDLKISHLAIYKKLRAHTTGQKIRSYNILAYIVADRNKTRDEFEQKMLQMVTSTRNISLDTELGKNFYLKPILLSNSAFTDSIHLRMRKNRPTFYTPSIWSLKEKFIDITYNVCPYIEVNNTNITIDEWETNISFENDGRSYNIQSGPGVTFVNGKVLICVETFKKLTKERVKGLVVFLYYFQVVCISLSVACLILSLLTYFLFTSLRTLPGLNNISLCVSLATAQICLLITADYGVQGHLTSGFCMFNAILLHFTWLASFAWMSACCIRMFLAFNSFNLHRNVGNSDLKRYFRYCLYGYGIPALIVILTMTINVTTTSGASVGYDDTICFLDIRNSVLNVVLSMLVPLCIMVIGNGVLFTMTVFQMVSVAEVQKSASVTERRGVMTYANLSTLTGISCVISAVGVWLENDILQLITCPLMALQGVFIFVSFIFNKRVDSSTYRLKCLQTLVPTDSSTYRLQYLQTLVPTDSSTYSFLHIQTPVPTDSSTNRLQYLQNLANTDSSTYRLYHIQTLAHTDSSTYRL